MLMMSFSVGTLGVVGGTLVVLIAALIMVKQRQEHDTERRAIADLTNKVRHPWTYRVRRFLR